MHARRILSVTLAVLIHAAPAAAQTNKVGISLFGGSATYSNMATGSGSIVRMTDGWLGGMQLEVPFGRLGLRLNGTYTDRSIMNSTPVNLNVYTADLDLMLRLLKPKPGRMFAPYIALGGGGVLYNLGSTTTTTTLGGETYGPDPVWRPTVMGALGFDIGPGPVALRLEMSDILDLHSPLQDAGGSAYGPVQHVAVSAGLSFRIGSRRAVRDYGDMAPQARSSQAWQPNAADEPQAEPPVPVAEPATPVASEQPAAAAATEPATADKPAADGGAAALAARFDAWDKVESLEVQIAQLKNRVDELESMRTASAPASKAAAPTAMRNAASYGELYTVQIGSFSDAQVDRANKVVAEMKSQGIPVWVTRTEVQGRMMNRVRVGALPDKSAAESLGRYIHSAFDEPTWVTHVDASDQVPDGTVEKTQAFVKGRN
ncbi:MAG TPA: SPOR domain-containing protein [Longimicrobiales bacterium]|nr:SPOR domain-containing protein [Longimicrobiales bacterium]